MWSCVPKSLGPARGPSRENLARAAAIIGFCLRFVQVRGRRGGAFPEFGGGRTGSGWGGREGGAWAARLAALL